MTTPSTRRIDEIGDESRRRILDAAEKLFYEKGFERTSFVDIARESGISRGSIPWHFKSKDGLLLAVVERVNERGMQTGQIPPEELTVQRLLESWRSYVRADGPRVMFMLLTEAMHSEGRVHDLYVDYLASQRREIRRWLLLWDLSPERSVALAATIGSVLMGAQLQYGLDPEGFDLDGTLTVLIELLERELGQVRAEAAVRAKQAASARGKRVRRDTAS